jgi:hypothetical protein
MTDPINVFELKVAIDKLKLYESADNDIIQADLFSHSVRQYILRVSTSANKCT